MPQVSIVTIHAPDGQGHNADDAEDSTTMDDKDYHHLKLRLHNEFDGLAARRQTGANHYAENVRYSYLIQRDRYSQADAFAFQKASEAGAGRTRVESNTPASTQTVGGGGV